MYIFKRQFTGFIKGLVITAATGFVAGFLASVFVSERLALVVAAVVAMLLLYITVCSENIRLELDGETLRYYQNGKQKGDFHLPGCSVRYRMVGESSFPPSYDIDLYLVDHQNNPDQEFHIDCSPLGCRQFNKLYGLIEGICPDSVTKLQTIKRSVSNPMESLLQNKVYLVYIGLVLVAMVFSMVIRNVMTKKNNARSKQDYCGRYPDAAKVFLTQGGVITSEAVQVLSVNDEYPATFIEGTSNGFYVKPGGNVIEVTYSYTRPGILYKNVTKSTGNVKQEIEVEPYKSYKLGFDRKAECFTFEELSTLEPA